MVDIFKVKKEILEQAVVQTTLALSEYTGSGEFILPVLHTDPQLYVAFGTKKALKELKEGTDNDRLADSTG